ncbi:unnamed protein product [Spodoptera littoralis]|uniref:Glutathione transferase n=1 Tax=Spodoptera littoralis TaxID=7109 RepID=A0A9P0IDG8_SPOLI|nr:unnamed protein product [Spodoptera littoralis]CAH1644204.1 unnamed protein product [Spodoptera littoralis]
MGVKLYAMDFSPPSRACMMACEIFGVPFEKIPVNLFNNEHLTPEFLEKNPLHTIPVLEDGDLILYDSHAILAYLADTYAKDESWYPKDVKKRALVSQKLFFNVAIIFRRLRIISYYVIQKGRKTLEQDWLDDIVEAYGFLEAFLSKTKYIAADHITIADLAILSFLTTLEYILPVDAKKYPKTSAWLEDFKAKPYAKKYNEEGAKILFNYINDHLTS